MKWPKAFTASRGERCHLQIRGASSKLERHSSRRSGECQPRRASGAGLRQFAVLTSVPRREEEQVDIDVRSQTGVKVIKLRGRLNLGEAVDRMRQTFDDLMAAGEIRFVVDLEEVSMVDSSGIGLLVRCLTEAKQSSGSLKLLKPSKFAVQTLRMTGLLKLFEVFDDPEQAVASFS
jgi:anti-sigma B factor antagonist